MSATLRDLVDGLDRCASCGGIASTRGDLMRWQADLRRREQAVAERERCADAVEVRHAKAAQALALHGAWGAQAIAQHVERLAEADASASEIRRVAERLARDIREADELLGLAAALGPTW
jgi:hypothetical protein